MDLSRREMPHPADFVDAHHRHWADAELLFEHDRWANADQLYYAHGGYCGRTDVETHRNAADAVGTIVESARQNGLL